MAAQPSNPGGYRPFSLTDNDQNDLIWHHAQAEGDVGRMKAASLERGSGTTVNFDKMTDRQMRAAKRQGRILEIRALMAPELWATLSRYWSPECARVRVEASRAAPGKEDTLAPLSAADRELRLCALFPYTTKAKAAGEALVADERSRERSRRAAAGSLRLVASEGDTVEAPEPAESGEAKPAPASGSLEEAVAACVEKPGEGSIGYLMRRGAAINEWHRKRVQGPWVAPALAPDQLRDAAVRAIRKAEHMRDTSFLRDVRKEASQMYDQAQDAWVRARRTVKGKDGEERRQEKADRWIAEQTCTRLKEDVSAFVAALESSSRLRTS